MAFLVLRMLAVFSLSLLALSSVAQTIEPLRQQILNATNYTLERLVDHCALRSSTDLSELRAAQGSAYRTFMRALARWEIELGAEAQEPLNVFERQWYTAELDKSLSRAKSLEPERFCADLVSRLNSLTPEAALEQFRSGYGDALSAARRRLR